MTYSFRGDNPHGNDRMKTVLFVRGVNSFAKRDFVARLMKTLNPDINTTRALRVSIDDYVTPASSPVDRKAASKTCRNMTKRVLGGNHQEQFVVINNESLRAQDWSQYLNLVNVLDTTVQFWGIDFYDPEKINTEDSDNKINEQTKNSTLFIASVTKYMQIKTVEDADAVLNEFKLPD